MTTYIAAAALVIAKDETDRDIYIYQGVQVPDNVTEESLKRLAKEGFITKVKAADSAPEIPEGEPTDKWTNDQLTAYASTLSIDLGGATTKSDILAAITAAK